MNIGRNVLIYTVSSLVAGAVPLLLLPIMTRYLTEQDFGAFAVVTTLIAIVTPALSWGTSALTSVEFYKMPAPRFAAAFSSFLLLPLASFAICLLLTALFGTWLGHWLELRLGWIAAAVLMALLALPQIYMCTLLRMRNEPYKYAAMEFGAALLTVGLTLSLIVGAHMDWTGRIYATGISSAVMCVISLWWLRRRGYLVARVDKESVRDATRFGAGVVLHDIGGQLIRYGDRLLLGVLLGLASTGQYAVAASIASMMLVMVAAFNRAWSPFIFARLSTGTDYDRREVVRMSYLAIGAFFVLFVCFNVATPLLYRWFVNAKFHDSMPYVLWLTLGYFFSAVYMTYIDYIFFLKKTYYLSFITSFNLACNLTLNYFLVKSYGAIGAAYAFCATMLLVTCLAFLIANRLQPMPWLDVWSRKPGPQT